MKLIIKSLLLILFPVLSYSQLFINEVMSDNDTSHVDNFNQYEDWVEIYNRSNAPIDLAGYYLSDNPAEPLKWEVPASNPSLTTVPANGFAIFWFDDDESQGANHTNFKLSDNGEWLGIMSYNGINVSIVDSLTVPAVKGDYSYGRASNNNNNLVTFSVSSFNANNARGTKKVEDVVFSKSGGKYASATTVTLSCPTPNAQIRYTLDGSEPQSNSPLYTGPISVTGVSTIRASGFRLGWEKSEPASETYLVGINHALPVITINTDPDNLWDDQIGIYVTGTNGLVANCGSVPHNYNQPWERRANVQFYEADGTFGFNIDAGISIAGGCSRKNAQKGLNIETKRQYGSKNIPYQVFPNRDQHEFRRLKLRSGGNDWNRSSIRDAVTQKFVEDKIDLDVQGSRNVVLYLNDEYWGIMRIRDTYSQHYINFQHEKVDKDSINLFECYLTYPIDIDDLQVSEGSGQDFVDLLNFMDANDLSVTNNYNYVSSKIEVSEFINYHIIQTFAANTDWPRNNYEVWNESGGKKYRWLLFDTDFGLGRQQNNDPNSRTTNPPNFDALHFATQDQVTGWPNDPASTMMLRKLLANTEFKNEFIQRYATQLNILFDPSRTTAIVDSFRNELAPDMQDHLEKFNLRSKLVNNWHEQVDLLNDWLTLRHPFVYTNIRDHFGLSGTYNLTVNVNASTKGRVMLNENEFLAPINYTGKYFDNVPMVLTAVADPGYRFSHWQETGVTDARVTVNYSTNKTLTPVFVSASDLVINELHYNPLGNSESAEFLEIYNPDSSPKQIGTYTFTRGLCFDFPANTTIGPGEYIILAKDASVYAGNGYQVFEWDQSSLDNGGEFLQLENGAGQIIDSLRYNDKSPWVATADNGFYSLGLISPTLDNALPESWDVQSRFITPGALNEFQTNNTEHDFSGIAINEIHYLPYDSIISPGDSIGGKNFEFVEIKNITNAPIDMTGMAFAKGITYSFPDGTILPANGFIVLAEDSLRFIDRYGMPPSGEYSGKLDNGGEELWLVDSTATLLDVVDYKVSYPWPVLPSNRQYSLGCIDCSVDNDSQVNWFRQSIPVTPFAENVFDPNVIPSYDGLVINEFHFNPVQGSSLEYIEIKNISTNLMFLTDVSFTQGVNYTFPDQFPFAPGAHIVIAKDSIAFFNHFGFSPAGEYSGTLSNTGEIIRVEDLFGNTIDLVNYSASFPWNPTPANGQFSAALIDPNYDNDSPANWSQQNVQYTPGAQNTFGAINRVTDIIINEIHYDPIGGGIHEFIELKNNGPGITFLPDVKLSGGISYSFADTDLILSGGFIVLARNAAGFQAKYGFAPHGQYSGALSNDGEVVKITDLYNTTVDQVNYGISSPWDSTPSQGDYSLALLDGNMDNANPASWTTQDVFVTPRAENSFPLCKDFIIESNMPAIPAGLKQANINITSNGHVDAANQVIFRAGDNILLNPEFEVLPGAQFEAVIGPCN